MIEETDQIPMKNEDGATTYITRNKPPSDEFVKHDQGKPEMKYLLDTPLASGEKCRVRAFGDAKYDRFNWYKCEEPERYLSACLRHLHEIAQDPLKTDEESDIYALAHALCDLEFYFELLLREKQQRDYSLQVRREANAMFTDTIQVDK